MEKYDAIIIGSGQGGTPLSKKLADTGWKTALIEQKFVGGTCINYGCTPTKTMIASARIAYLADKSKELGVNVPDYEVDIRKIMDRKNEIVSSFRGGAEKGLQEQENLELIYGKATFSGYKTVEVTLNSGGTEELMAKHIFINTGTNPVIPSIDGLDEGTYLTTDSILELEEIPDHLLIIGGSYVGLEFGQMYRRFGSKVTIVEQAEKFLSKEDEDVAEELKKILEDEGIEVLLNSEVTRVNKEGNVLHITLNQNENSKTIHCSHLLLGAGRKPNTDYLNLKVSDVETDSKGFIRINEKLETSVNGIYAIGEVNGGPAFTHISYNDHLVILKNLLENENVNVSGRMVPYCMFTDPQLGRIGLTEQEARKKGLNIQVAKIPMKHVARAIETGDTRGLMKAVVDKNSKKILGAAVLGTEGGEIMSVLQMAMMGGITSDEIREGIFAHPTYTESLNNLFATLQD